MSDRTDKLIDELLEGIDADELENGWWETGDGVEFGKSKLTEVKLGVSEIIYELESQLNFMKFVAFWAVTLVIVLVGYVILAEYCLTPL